MIDVECWMVDSFRIQNSKLLIQNFAGRAECAFPRDHFLTESERSGERLLKAARRVSESESINRISRMGVKWQSKLILNVG
jgi:hypothetical protein